MFRSLTCLLVSGAVFLAACGDDGTEPGDVLTEADAQFVADLIDTSADGVLNDFFDSSGSDPENAPALTHGPIVWTRTFERSRACHVAGTLTIAGMGTSTWDAGAVTYDVDSEGTATRAGCAYTDAGGVVITLDSEGTWTHERHYADFAPAGIWITAYEGSFSWSKTGGNGNCTYDLVRTVDTAANTRSLTGTSCGTTVDNTRTWR